MGRRRCGPIGSLRLREEDDGRLLSETDRHAIALFVDDMLYVIPKDLAGRVVCGAVAVAE